MSGAANRPRRTLKKVDYIRANSTGFSANMGKRKRKTPQAGTKSKTKSKAKKDKRFASDKNLENDGAVPGLMRA